MSGWQRVRVAETLVLHGSDLLRWRDGASAADAAPAAMTLLDRPVALVLDDPPPDLRWLHKPGRTALWRRPTRDMTPGLADAAVLARPDLPRFRLAGTVIDPTGGYLPRRFDVELGAGRGLDLLLFPSPAGTRFGGGGGLSGTLRFDLDSDDPPAVRTRPAAFALVEISVSVGDNDTRRFRAQADANGDFRLSLWRLRPLPDGTDAFPAQLSVRAAPERTDAAPLDPDALEAIGIALVPPPADPPEGPPEPLPAAAFAATLALDLVPGVIQRLPSTPPHLLALRPLPP